MARNIAQVLLCLTLPTNWLVIRVKNLTLNDASCIRVTLKWHYVLETNDIFCTNEWSDTHYLNRVDFDPRCCVQMLTNYLQEIGWSVLYHKGLKELRIEIESLLLNVPPTKTRHHKR